MSNRIFFLVDYQKCWGFSSLTDDILNAFQCVCHHNVLSVLCVCDVCIFYLMWTKVTKQKALCCIFMYALKRVNCVSLSLVGCVSFPFFVFVSLVFHLTLFLSLRPSVVLFRFACFHSLSCVFWFLATETRWLRACRAYVFTLWFVFALCLYDFNFDFVWMSFYYDPHDLTVCCRDKCCTMNEFDCYIQSDPNIKSPGFNVYLKYSHKFLCYCDFFCALFWMTNVIALLIYRFDINQSTPNDL